MFFQTSFLEAAELTSTELPKKKIGQKKPNKANVL